MLLLALLRLLFSPAGPAPACCCAAPAAPPPPPRRPAGSAIGARPAWRTAGTASCRCPWETPAARAGPAGRQAGVREGVHGCGAIGAGIPAAWRQRRVRCPHPLQVQMEAGQGGCPGTAPACLPASQPASCLPFLWHPPHLLQRLDDFGHVIQLAGVGLEGELHLHAAARSAQAAGRGEFGEARAGHSGSWLAAAGGGGGRGGVAAGCNDVPRGR